MNSPSPAPTAQPHEQKRFKIACGIAMVLGVFVLAVVFIFGDAPRPTVDLMKRFFVSICFTAFSVLVYGIWRFRRKTNQLPH